MKRNEDGTFMPGVIYELGFATEDEWFPFYVGETTNADVRIAQHRSSAKTGTQLLVYDFMREVVSCNLVTELAIIDSYGEDGPADLEDEHIMVHLLNGIKLQNQKKGSAVWMKNMLATKDKMMSSGHTSLREFKIWDAEQVRLQNDARHQARVEAETQLSWHDQLIKSIKESSEYTDSQKLKQMQQEVADAKTADILKLIKR